MKHDRAIPPPMTIPGWRILTSDAGRLWATRERPFTTPQMKAGAERTVDGDDVDELVAAVAAQEARAEAVSR
ncbi:hypothetical protein [Planotetraspora sp. GP83]|uniref:hypothetical protein n=1 Tax=Planotetraspora sp. GP83 TaxID=3156264 RepID=UPI003517C95A